MVEWYGYTRSWPVKLTELAILRLANTVMGEVGAHNQVVGVGKPLWPRGQDHG